MCFKQAIICPLLKKQNLNKEELKNYTPVGNLPFVSKIIEKTVANILEKHIGDNNLYYKNQCAYRMYHSTETALVKIQVDIMAAIDKRHSSAMIMLDLSSAVDTLDHSISARLRNMYGIRGASLRWFYSYLSDRRQYVSLNGVHSDTVQMDFGVSQGSVLRPKLFSLSVKALSEVITGHGLS